MTKVTVPALRAETADMTVLGEKRADYERFDPTPAGTLVQVRLRDEELNARELIRTHLEPAMEKKEDVNDELTGGGISPSSRSRSKRSPAAGARRDLSRLNDAGVRILQSRRPNAQKHGAFSACPTIPGEDPREFQELHSALIDEWQPSGPSEEDAVLSLADLMWRKRRGQRFVQAKLMVATFDPGSPAYDERHGVALFAYAMATAPEVAFETCGKFLPAEMPDRLKQKFPRSSDQSTTDWAEAILTEIQSMLQPAAARQPGRKLDDLTAAAKAVVKLILEQRTVNTVGYATEFLEDELKSRERLEAMIDRKTKHLIQLKAMKQMLRQTSAARDDEPPKRITARNGLQ
jgi:hypothetical protein